VKRLLAPVIGLSGVLCAAGLVYAQAVQPPPATPLPDPFNDPTTLPDPLGQQAAPPEEAPPPAPGDTPSVLAPVDPGVLTAQENRASTEMAAEAAENLEPIEPPPPPPPPMRRPRYQAAVIRAVDKVTAETIQFEAKIGQPVRYKTLIFTLRACETTAEDEDFRDDMAHLVVTSEPKMAPGKPVAEARQVFRGWTFASSPGLQPFEHPVYDAWLISCKTSAPAKAAGAA
jgi:hypothetical protein